MGETERVCIFFSLAGMYPHEFSIRQINRQFGYVGPTPSVVKRHFRNIDKRIKLYDLFKIFSDTTFNDTIKKIVLSYKKYISHIDRNFFNSY